MRCNERRRVEGASKTTSRPVIVDRPDIQTGAAP
jgi:hypothetical protein